MDALNNWSAKLSPMEGYWVRTSVKVELTKEESV